MVVSPRVHVRGRAADLQHDRGRARGLARSLLAGESLYFQSMTARRDDCDVLLAPGQMGDIVLIELDGDVLMLQRGAFLACCTRAGKVQKSAQIVVVEN